MNGLYSLCFVPCTDASLPFAALQLLAPPVRLVSAALWKVLKQRDVVQYGVVEEFVTSACETVPGLLTVRHQGKLALGLRGRVRETSLYCVTPMMPVSPLCFNIILCSFFSADLGAVPYTA